MMRWCRVNGDCHRWCSLPALPRPVSCLKTSFTSAQISSLQVNRPKSVYSARGARVVVAGAEVDVAPQLALLAAHDHQHLGVGLVADDAVHDVRADFLELRRPVDVGLLVEARHQLDDDGDLLAVARGVDQRLHQHRVGAGAVHGLLDRDHVAGPRAACCMKAHHRRERLERVVQQDVAGADGLEHVDALGERARERRAGTAGTARSARSTSLGHLHQAHQVHRAVDLVEVVRAEPELLQQELGHLRRAVVGDLEAHGVAEVALRQLALQRGAQVLHVLLVDEEVAVARDAELVAAEHLHARRRARCTCSCRIEERKTKPCVPARELGRQLDHARQDARRLHDRDARRRGRTRRGPRARPRSSGSC